MITAQEIKEKAMRCGACDIIEEAQSIADLIALMGTPQGREFCKLHRFPSVDILRQHKVELADMNVYVDAGVVDVSNTDNIILVGDTTGLVKCDNTDKPYHVLVMHGAKAIVNAYDYAICQITLIGHDSSAEGHEWNNASIFMK